MTKAAQPANADINAAFLARLQHETREDILRNIAEHYGISSQAAYAEVCQPSAENLLDYMVEPLRGATYVLMQGYGFASGAK